MRSLRAQSVVAPTYAQSALQGAGQSHLGSARGHAGGATAALTAARCHRLLNALDHRACAHHGAAWEMSVGGGEKRSGEGTATTDGTVVAGPLHVAPKWGVDKSVWGGYLCGIAEPQARAHFSESRSQPPPVDQQANMARATARFITWTDWQRNVPGVPTFVHVRRAAGQGNSSVFRMQWAGVIWTAAHQWILFPLVCPYHDRSHR